MRVAGFWSVGAPVLVLSRTISGRTEQKKKKKKKKKRRKKKI